MRAVVIGAGIAGLAVAQRLTRTGWDVVVVEKAPGPRAQGYMIDFFGPGYDAAEAMGVLPRLQQLGYRVQEVSYLNHTGRVRAKMDYARFERVLDGRLFSIMRPDIERALLAEVLRDVDLRYGRAVEAIDNRPDGVRATLSDGSTVEADLLVGADGIHSTVRELTFGPERDYLRYLGFHTAAYVFDDPQIYHRVQGRFCLTDTPNRVVGLYGLRDGTVAAFAVHRAADPAMPEDTQQAVRTAYSSLGWMVPRALEHVPEPAELYYDQVAQIDIPDWHRGRVVLVGDACQAVSLLAGQGASLGVAGAYMLGEQLAGAGSVEAGLQRYQERWQPLVAEKQAVGRRSAEWVLPSSRARVWMRRAMLRLARLPGVEKHVATAVVGRSNLTLEELSAVGDHALR